MFSQVKLNTHKYHSTANKRDMCPAGMLRDVRTITKVTILELGIDGNAKVAIPVRILQNQTEELNIFIIIIFSL